MKLLCKLVLLVLAAKLLASPPKADPGVLNHVAGLTIKDVATGINDAWTGAEAWISGLWNSQTTPAKASSRHGKGAHHPVG